MKPTPSTFLRLVPALAASALLSVLAATSGCLAVAAGAGAGAAVAYVRGDLDTTLDAGFAKSVRAAEAALGDLKYAKIRENRDALQAMLVYRNAADQKVELYLAQTTEAATKLKIRVGTFGDEALQQEILARVKGNL